MTHLRVSRREFLGRAGWGGLAATAALSVSGRTPAWAQGPPSYPDFVAASTKPPRRGGILTRTTAWDLPVLDPRLTNSVELFQIYSLTGNRMVRYLYSDEASSPTDLTLKGDLAESWEGNSDYRVWTFKLKRGVKWHNMPPVNGRELVAADIKYCFEAYAKEGVQAFTFGEIEDIETPDKHTLRIHLKSPNTMFPQNLAEAVAVIFPKEIRAHAQGASRAGAESRLLRKGHSVPGRVPHSVHTGRGHAPGRFSNRPERYSLDGGARRREHTQADQPQRRDPVPQDNGFLAFQPHLRNIGALAIRRNDGYGSSTLARLWIDK